VWFENRWEASDPIRIVNVLEHTTGWDDLHLREYAKQAPDNMSVREGLDYDHHSYLAMAARHPDVVLQLGTTSCRVHRRKAYRPEVRRLRAAKSLSADRDEDCDIFRAGFAAASMEDFDRLVALEDKLIGELEDLAMVDGHDFGLGAFNIFILTDDPAESFGKAHRIVTNEGVPNVMRSAYREVDHEDYTILWLSSLTEFSVL
jgi:hypothetical protein